MCETSFSYCVCIALPPNLACQTGMFNTSWSIAVGTASIAGTSSNYLNTPMDIFVDGNKDIYVADYANNRVQKFPPGYLKFI